MRFALFIGTAILLGGVQAPAATLVVNGEYRSAAQFPEVFAAAIPQFDGSLGTLNSVNILIKGFVDSFVSVTTFNLNSGVEIDPVATSDYSISTPSSFTLGSSNFAVTPLTETGEVIFLFYAYNTNFASIPQVEFSYSLNADPSQLAQFIGAGIIEGQIGFGSISVGEPRGPNDIYTYYASPVYSAASFQLVYDFTPTPAVPEPATWAMMLIGFGAIGSAVRRRRAFNS